MVDGASTDVVRAEVGVQGVLEQVFDAVVNFYGKTNDFGNLHRNDRNKDSNNQSQMSNFVDIQIGSILTGVDEDASDHSWGHSSSHSEGRGVPVVAGCFSLSKDEQESGVEDNSKKEGPIDPLESTGAVPVSDGGIGYLNQKSPHTIGGHHPFDVTRIAILSLMDSDGSSLGSRDSFQNPSIAVLSKKLRDIEPDSGRISVKSPTEDESRDPASPDVERHSESFSGIDNCGMNFKRSCRSGARDPPYSTSARASLSARPSSLTRSIVTGPDAIHHNDLLMAELKAKLKSVAQRQNRSVTAPAASTTRTVQDSPNIPLTSCVSANRTAPRKFSLLQAKEASTRPPSFADFVSELGNWHSKHRLRKTNIDVDAEKKQPPSTTMSHNPPIVSNVKVSGDCPNRTALFTKKNLSSITNSGKTTDTQQQADPVKPAKEPAKELDSTQCYFPALVGSVVEVKKIETASSPLSPSTRKIDKKKKNGIAIHPAKSNVNVMGDCPNGTALIAKKNPSSITSSGKTTDTQQADPVKPPKPAKESDSTKRNFPALVGSFVEVRKIETASSPPSPPATPKSDDKKKKKDGMAVRLAKSLFRGKDEGSARADSSEAKKKRKERKAKLSQTLF